MSAVALSASHHAAKAGGGRLYHLETRPYSSRTTNDRAVPAGGHRCYLQTEAVCDCVARVTV